MGVPAPTMLHAALPTVAVPIGAHLRAPAALVLGAPAAAALTLGSAATFAAGFPPLSWTAAPWLALAPLMVASAAVSPARAALLGFGWTLAVGAAVAWCLPAMLAGFFGLATPLAWLAALLVIGVLHGAFIAAWSAWVAWLAARGAASPLLLAGGWVAAEYARTASVGSPWALTAYSQIGWTPIIQIADLGGPFAIGLLIAAVNACLAAACAPRLRGPRPWRTAGITAGALFAALLYGNWRLTQDFAAGPSLPVAVVQAGAPVAEPAARAARLARHVALTRQADAAGGLVVWPEHALDGYLAEHSPARTAVLRLAAETDAELILGGPHFEPSPRGTRYHNSAWLLRAGAVAARYDKHRLVPVAEDGRLRGLVGDGGTAYAPGDGPMTLPARAARAGVLLCVEAMAGTLARRAVDDGAALLVNLSNDAWFGHPDAARQQLHIATLRAVETRRWLVRAAATGFSAIIDPHGRITAASGFDTHELLRGRVSPARTRTVYQRCGDAFAWLVIAAVVGVSVFRTLSPTRRFPCISTSSSPRSPSA